MLAALGYWFTRRQAQHAEEQRKQAGDLATQQRTHEEEQAKLDRQQEKELAQDEERSKILETYLDRMTELLLAKDLRTSKPGTEVRDVAHIRTLTTISRLDSDRRTTLLNFLYHTGLLHAGDPIVSLQNANLSDIKLAGAELYAIDLSGANLSRADLSKTSLAGANLACANLSGANLSRASGAGGTVYGVSDTVYITLKKYSTWADKKNGGKGIGSINLSGAILTNADLSDADLSEASLDWSQCGSMPAHTKLNGAKLSGTKLEGATLAGADLQGAQGITTEELVSQASSLEGATMPDGRPYQTEEEQEEAFVPDASQEEATEISPTGSTEEGLPAS